jgi:hypothetical protein
LKDAIITSNINQTIPPEIECECKARWEADVKFSDVTRSSTNILKNH